MKVLPPLDETRMEVAEPAAPAPPPLAVKRSASSSSSGSRGNRSVSCAGCKASKVRAGAARRHLSLLDRPVGWEDDALVRGGGAPARR